MSIYRISSNMITDNGVTHLRGREYAMDKVESQLNTGKKYRLPRENPVDVAQAMTFHTKIGKIDQFMANIQDAESERSLVEVKMMNTIDVMQRIRELAVQGANGIYTEDERKGMAEEVDQLLRNIILDANSKYKGNYLFSGFKKYTQPFESLEGAVRGINKAMITEVKYLGDNGKHLREVDYDEYIAAGMPGSDVYWAENFQIFSQINTANFRLTQDSNIMVDGIKIEFNEGDNIYAIMDKMNKSNAAINASVDMVTGGLILKSTKPHKLELSDIEGGTLLQDLGILEPGRAIGPDNLNTNATVFGGSIFDTIIGLRDAMLTNNAEDIGGRFLGSIDSALSNLLYHTAESGALNSRLTNLGDRFSDDKISYTDSLSKIEDVDVTESISQLKLLEFAHRVGLSTLAQLSRVSLMDFMR